MSLLAFRFAVLGPLLQSVDFRVKSVPNFVSKYVICGLFESFTVVHAFRDAEVGMKMCFFAMFQ